MPVELNHTIVSARDKRISAEFLASILGLAVGAPVGSFVPVTTSNGVTLDFMNSDQETIPTQHYAFLVSEKEFDAIFHRIQRAKIAFYADPQHEQRGQINHRHGRGLYFRDPSGHNMEILTHT